MKLSVRFPSCNWSGLKDRLLKNLLKSNRSVDVGLEVRDDGILGDKGVILASSTESRGNSDRYDAVHNCVDNGVFEIDDWRIEVVTDGGGRRVSGVYIGHSSNSLNAKCGLASAPAQSASLGLPKPVAEGAAA